MKHVVVRPGKSYSRVYIVDGDEAMDLPFESWALRDGKQILFVNTRMPKLLHNQHIGGTYETGAMYIYTYEELCAVLTVHLGPSDRERYDASLKEQSQPVLIQEHLPTDYLGKWPRIAYILWKTLVLIIKVSIKSLNVLLFLVLLPLIIKIFNGFRK